MLYAGFFPIFGNLQIYQSNFLNLGFWNSNYTREHCLTQNTDPYMCPHKNGVIFTLVVLCFYLILTNIVFINLLISTFGQVEIYYFFQGFLILDIIFSVFKFGLSKYFKSLRQNNQTRRREKLYVVQVSMGANT